MAERPNYIYQGGNVIMHSPLQLTNSEMYGFFVKGDLKNLQRTVRQHAEPGCRGPHAI